ncbi:hypothetical protein [Cryptosporangium minutisporangium]|uniref:hypothetical protein n=1 Tax=Cryptosporangium minutisporangium TaxID=113569 RepID=UPI0035E939B5
MADSASAAAAAQPRPVGATTAELRERIARLAWTRARTATLRRPIGRASDLAAGHELDPAVELPIVAELRPLLPAGWGGLRRGATVAVPGSTSLLFALLAGVQRAGGWVAAAGVRELGIVAASESRVDLSRFALVPDPGPDWPTIIAALIDGLDTVVVTPPPGPVPLRVARSLTARARHQGSLLLSTTDQWPETDLTLQVTGRTWSGIGRGHGRLRGQHVTVRATGRRQADRPRTVTTAMPPPSLLAPQPDPPLNRPAPADAPFGADRAAPSLRRVATGTDGGAPRR